MIHPAANVHPTANIGRGVEIGPDSVIEKNVFIGDGTKIGARVVIGEGSHIGKSCCIFEFAKIGAAPPDFPCKGKKTLLVMGDENTVRECVTLDRGTAQGSGKTTIGHGNLFMANSHVGHDCSIGNHVVLAIGAALAGQNTVGDHAVLGGLAAVDQFYRIGAHALITASTHVSRDVPPYMLASGDRAKLFGPNSAALKNHGFSEETLKALKRAYYILFRAGLTLKKAMKRLDAEELAQIPQVKHILQFLQSSQKEGKP
jgi:UDP-N-acetylglucosamine acyltransferase